MLVFQHPGESLVSNLIGAAPNLRGGRPAWSTAVGLGPIPYWFAGSNPAPRISLCHAGENPAPASHCVTQVRTMFTRVNKGENPASHINR